VPGLVFEGNRDGKFRAFDSASGQILWTYDTVRTYTGVNGVAGKGGSMGHGGAVVANGMVYVNSGYSTSSSPLSGMRGNVLLAFGLR
jgi:polyvinyl alcohol dehydrogenase (cytochrome)